MKKKKIILILIIVIIIISLIVGGIVFFYYNREKNMDYKFEDDKLYITLNAKDWIEVPGDFSYTAEHLKEVNDGRYRNGTYQMDNKKIVFYYEFDTNNMNYEGLSTELSADLKNQYATHIVYSDDRGKTWNDVVIGVGAYSDGLLEIHFKNKNEGSMKLKGRDGRTIFDYKTNDGGTNWDTIE